jgi:hypothetical protein
LTTSLPATSRPKTVWQVFFMHFHASWLLMSVANAFKRIFRKGIVNKLNIRKETCHKHTYIQRHTHAHSQEQNETNKYQSCKSLFFYKAVLKLTNHISFENSVSLKWNKKLLFSQLKWTILDGHPTEDRNA